MSAKPRFKPIRMKLRGPDGHLYDVRATDARDLTPEKAVEKVFKNLTDLCDVSTEGLNRLLLGTGITARVVNGKVRVRRSKQ